MTIKVKQRPADDGERLDCGDVAVAGEPVYDDGWAAWCASCETRAADPADPGGRPSPSYVRAMATVAATRAILRVVDASGLRPAMADWAVDAALRALTSGDAIAPECPTTQVVADALDAARAAVAEVAS